jgi:hypothetical protein
LGERENPIASILVEVAVKRNERPPTTIRNRAAQRAANPSTANCYEDNTTKNQILGWAKNRFF